MPEIQERSLEEVHEDLDQLFTAETILAGHSVENDLKYLQLYYPYIIDTSIIFNISGTRLEKSSLQKLYAVFCGHLIQKTRLEHDPTEDARATMELIQLKLSESALVSSRCRQWRLSVSVRCALRRLVSRRCRSLESLGQLRFAAIERRSRTMSNVRRPNQVRTAGRFLQEDQTAE